jgi:aspartate aminotransferase
MLAGLATIPGITCSRPEGAFYVYPNISGLLARGGVKSPAEFANRLLHEAHLATVPGEGFGTHEHIRISYATRQSELDRGIERLRNFAESL